MFGIRFAPRVSGVLALAVFGCCSLPLHARGDKTKLDNGDPLNADSAWNGGAPGPDDWAIFDDSLIVHHAFTPGGDLTWRGIEVTTSGTLISFATGNTISLGDGGIDVAQDTSGCTIDSNVAVSASAPWNVAGALKVDGSVTLGNRQLTFQGPGATTVSGTISGAGGSCVVNTTGSLTLSGMNTFSGGLSLVAGTVIANTSLALGNFLGAASLSGGTLVVGATNLLYDNPIHATGNATIVGNAITTFDGDFSGNGTLHWNITGANARLDLGTVAHVPDFSAFTGTLDFGTSTAQIRLQGNGGSADVNLGNAPVNLGTGSAFMLPRNDSTQSIGALSGGPNTAIYGSSTGTATTTWIIGAINTATTFSGIIGNGKAATPSKTSLTKTGTGSLTLTSSASNYSGSLTIQNGAVVVSTPAGLGSGTAAISLGTPTTTGTLGYTGTGATLTRFFNISSAGAIDASGTGALVVNGPGGIAWGTLQQARTFTLTGGNTAFNTFVEPIIDGNPSAPVTVVKNGPGTWVLSNPNNTYSGGTKITGGTLLATAVGTPAGAGDIDVGDGSIFGGTSTIPGRVTVESGGHLSPGTPGSSNGVGTLTFINTGNAVTMNTGSILDLDLQDAPSPHDMAAITMGTLTLAGSVNVNVFQAGTNQLFTTDGSYDIFTLAGSSNLAGGVSLLQVANNTAQSGKDYNFVMLTASNGAATLSLQITDISTGHFWDGPTGPDHSWATAANWIGTIPGAPGDTATFGTSSTAAGSVLLDGPRHLGTLTFDNTAAYSLDPGAGGMLFLDNGTGNATVTVLTGSHAITAPVEVTSNTTISFADSTNALTLSGMITNNTGNTAASLTVTGPGILTLAGSDNYTGTTTVAASAHLEFAGTTTHQIGSLSGAGSVQIDSATVLVSNDVTVASLIINGTHVLRPNSPVSKVNTLSLAHTGSGSSAVYSSVLQLNNNRMIVQTADAPGKAAAILAINEALLAGQGTGNSWTGTGGITSAVVTADPQHLTIGVFDNKALARTDFAGGTNNIDANSLIVSPALIGDANLDGIVNFNDMLAVTGNWNTQGLVNGVSTIDFAHGDLNGDGIVNFNDMLVVTGHWNNTSSTFNMAAAVAEAFADAGVSIGAGIGASPVPEPTSLWTLSPFTVAMLLAFRRPQKPARRLQAVTFAPRHTF